MGAAAKDWAVTRSFNGMAPIGFDVYQKSGNGVEKVDGMSWFDWAWGQGELMFKTTEKHFSGFPNLSYNLVINKAATGEFRISVNNSSAPRKIISYHIYNRLQRDRALSEGVTTREEFAEYLRNGGTVVIPEVRAWNLQTGRVETMTSGPLSQVVMYMYTQGYGPKPPVDTRLSSGNWEPVTKDVLINPATGQWIILGEMMDFPTEVAGNVGNMIQGIFSFFGDFILFPNIEDEITGTSGSGRMIYNWKKNKKSLTLTSLCTGSGGWQNILFLPAFQVTLKSQKPFPQHLVF